MNILKKIICGILTTTIGLASFLFNTVSVYSSIPEDSIRSGDYDYIILEDDTACLVDYHGSEPNLVLPAQIDGKLVSTCVIRFWDFDYLKSINFPDSIIKLETIINNYYYYNMTISNSCSNLQHIYLNNVKEFRAYIDNIKTIYMPSSINYILYNKWTNPTATFSVDTMIVELDSYAERWAVNQSYPYRFDNRKWVEDGTGTWYLMSDDQVMYGWHRMNHKMYYLDPNQRGMMLTGWQYLGNAWYYLDPLNGGAVTSGWFQPDKSTSTWYFCDSYGIMKTGWIFYGNNWYYLNSSGEMLIDTTTPDGYYVDANGVWIS